MQNVDVDRELTDDDYDWLGARLGRVISGKIPNMEALDGFLTALVVSPELVQPSEYSRILVSGKTKAGDLAYDSLSRTSRNQKGV